MQSLSRLIKGIGILLCTLAAMVSPVVAGETRYFKDRDKNGDRIVLRATPDRILSGTFLATKPHTLKCDDDVVLVGGFSIKSTKITNGRFRTVSNGYMGEGGSWNLTVRGVLRGDAIRGAITFHFINRAAEGSFECWSGKGKKDPVVSYVARTG
ncbi:MAG TPA: hypothetical protein VF729_06370 [Solirubrobacterales bacterium]